MYENKKANNKIFWELALFAEIRDHKWDVFLASEYRGFLCVQLHLLFLYGSIQLLQLGFQLDEISIQRTIDI